MGGGQHGSLKEVDAGWGAGGRRRLQALRLALGRVGRVGVMGALLLPLAACGGFFQCENKPACPVTGGGSGSTVNYAFVAFTDTNGNSFVVGYDISAGTLKQVVSVSLPFLPVALAVSPNNGFLYVASAPGAKNPGVYGYAIGSAGGLTTLSSGAVLAQDTVAAMAISPDGGYLYTVNSSGAQMAEYTLNTSTGALASAGAAALSTVAPCLLSTGTPATQSCSVAVSPSKSYVVASLGTGGDAVFGFVAGKGLAANAPASTIPAGTSSGEFSVAIDGNNNAYVAQTMGLTVYALANGNKNLGTVAYASGVVPRGVVVDPQSKFVFTANEGTGTISAFTTGTTNALNAVAGSPFAGPGHVSALGVDSSDSYLVAAGYDVNAGVQLWSIAANGVISQLKTAGTSTATQNPVLVAMSH